MSATTIPVFGRLLNVHAIRNVWAAITHDPQATVRELADQLDMAFGDVQRAMMVLRDAGYVEQTVPRAARARRIVVPFVEVPK